MEDRLVDARDTHSSATILVVLYLVAGVIGLAAHSEVGIGWLKTLRLVQMGAAAATFSYLTATRLRPNPKVDFALCVTFIVTLYPAIALGAVRWLALGRPFEVFELPHLVMVTIPLVVPRSFWLGAALIYGFAVETVVLYAAFVHHGVGVDELPNVEPVVTLIYASLGIGLLRLREQRRTIIGNYMRVEAERTTLDRLAGSIHAAVEPIETSVATLRTCIDRLAMQVHEPLLLERMSGAVNRLRALGHRLQQLDRSGIETEAEVTNAESSTSSAERLVLARDSHDAVTSFTVLASITHLMGVAALARIPFGSAVWLLAGHSVLLVAALMYLLKTRERPSEIRSMVVFAVLSLTLVPIFATMDVMFARMGTVVELFIGPQVVMAILPMIIPRRLWLGAIIEAAMAAISIGLFYVLGFQRYAAHFSVLQPWFTLLYAMVGIGLLVVRDQRRAASVRLLRADAALTALARRSGLSMAVLDQAGSPMQMLALGLGLLRTKDADRAILDQMQEALHRITEASRSLPVGDAPVIGRIPPLL